MDTPDSVPRWRRWAVPLPAGALAFGLALGQALPLLPTLWRPPVPVGQVPESWVGLLAGPEGRTGLVVSSLPGSHTAEVHQPVPLGMPDGRTLYLWVVGAQGAVRPVGPVPAQPFSQLPLPAPADTLFADAAELGVSLERAGDSPEAPHGPFIYQGPCNRLWRAGASIARR